MPIRFLEKEGMIDEGFNESARWMLTAIATNEHITMKIMKMPPETRNSQNLRLAEEKSVMKQEN